MPAGRTFPVAITPGAQADLRAIEEAIAADSPERAIQFVRVLREAIASLSRFPLRHAVAPEGIVDRMIVRHRIVGAYRVLFIVQRRLVIVLAVRHTRRLPIGH